MVKKRNFSYDVWNYDGDGNAYIITKDTCPNITDVPEFIKREARLQSLTLDDINEIKEGVCKWQVRTDWENCDGRPIGWYYINDSVKTKKGYFPVWIVRCDDWY